MYTFFGLLIVCTAIVGGHGFPDSRIVGGTDALVGEFPYIVSLRLSNRHFCGGSIIARRYILTAAHCLEPFNKYYEEYLIKRLTVHAGTNYLKEAGDVYHVEKIIIHSDHNYKSNDIGLIRLKTDIVYHEVVQPIPFAVTNSVQDDESCVLSGWGRFGYDRDVSNKLQKLDLKVFSQTHCSYIFNLSDTYICAFVKDGKGACKGDSGGPLVANGVQIGIVSFGYLCAQGYPDVYTRVSAYKNWLEKNIEYTE